MGRGGAAGVAAGLATGPKTEVITPGFFAAEAGGGAGGAGAAACAGVMVTTVGTEAGELVGGGAPGASVGSLIVGADVGLGGKLMRTVSFLGWTLEASAGLGGIAPPGDVGIFSAII